ncbi:MAG: UDP-N-acetylmuramate dehydrogenase [Lysobacter sp.]|nr:UDP-N-acetylmuramate dehydrogenase [Lysobacter sp.]
MTARSIASAPLRNTFGVDARAGRLIETDDADDLPGLFAGELAGASPLVVGSGSNLLIVEGPALALALTSNTIRILASHDGHAIVRADAGTQWHAFVLWTLEQGLAGLENLALIPGTVGAAPIQNIGAYGVEVGERIHAVEVFERATGAFQRFDAAACAFAYRDSVFKHALDRYLITAVEFALPQAAALPSSALRLDYAGIREELAVMGMAAMGIDAPDARTVAEAVIRLRRRKLPDPAVVGNAGSFFKNPIVPLAQAEALLAAHPRLPVFRGAGDDSRKLSAAWLIDACGWKGRRSEEGSGDAAVSAQHALVLVNHGRATGAELLALARRIAEDVQARFGVAIEPEPRLIGARW